ncbi:Fe-Mn family superoxide dismutase [Haloferula luteola]|uniref:Superoxide dismutase n=1 Tax=Haloferula luteola TaxID=595692 RepID=A0A840V909_9BACT|nr:superoxide dismutase [Haloferula luteola]MBB5350450.1 Fe-Mn family superoxide dismutase [Haloferula luteola]
MQTPISRRRFTQLTALAAAAGGSLPRLTRAAEATLPDLPFAFDALEPHIDAMTMEIHHDKHHAGYVAKLNAALKESPDLASLSLDDLMPAISGISDSSLQTAVRNNGGGHWNHRFFWESLTPASQSGKPGTALAAALDEAFGSLAAFKEKFGAAAGSRFGSGWAWLIVQDGKLAVVSTPNQDNPLMKGITPADALGTPILGLDVWEHAYYLHYQNRRPDYVSAWWNVVNWEAANSRFEAALG